MIFHLTGSPWRDKISLAILEMQEKGVIQWYYNKWWTPETVGKEELYQCNREYKKQDNKASALGVDSIGPLAKLSPVMVRNAFH